MNKLIKINIKSFILIPWDRLRENWLSIILFRKVMQRGNNNNSISLEMKRKNIINQTFHLKNLKL